MPENVPFRDGSGPPGDRWRREWFALTAAAAVALTGLDAVLLQQKKAFFTGGFLAVDAAATPLEGTSFVAASLLSDAAVLGGLVLAALWSVSRLRLTVPARALWVVSLALAPLVAVDFINYRLLAYLGDAFDLSLMFDLTGGNPEEMLAVASGHLGGPALLGLAAAAGVGLAVWFTNTRLPGRRGPGPRIPARALVLAGGVFVFGLVVSGVLSASSDVMDNGLKRKPSGQAIEWVTKRITDVDRDGFGIGGTMADPDPFDSRIFPYALDHPGNGLDENGVGGDLPPGLPPYHEGDPEPAPWTSRPDVVFFMLESFRADAVGADVDGRPVAPVLESLARAGVAPRRVFSHNGYTAHSRFHTLAGSLVDLRGGRSIVDDFKAQGYEVAYFSGQDESFGGPALGVGFDRADVAYDARQDRRGRYSTFTTPGSLAVPFSVVLERIAAFAAERDSSRPLFLYVNFHDTHYPYSHAGVETLVAGERLDEARITPAHAAALRRMYLNTAANVDRAIGETLNVVRRHLARPPAVVVTADHGESLFEENFLGHGYALNDVQTRIPLIVTGLPMHIREPVGQVELRDAIVAALAAPDSAAPPRVTFDPEKTVFQYLGNLHRPRQIAFAGAGSRAIFDFRTHRYRDAGIPWTHPDDLTGAAADRFLELIRYWERMMLARRDRGLWRDVE